LTGGKRHHDAAEGDMFERYGSPGLRRKKRCRWTRVGAREEQTAETGDETTIHVNGKSGKKSVAHIQKTRKEKKKHSLARGWKRYGTQNKKKKGKKKGSCGNDSRKISRTLGNKGKRDGCQGQTEQWKDQGDNDRD